MSFRKLAFQVADPVTILALTALYFVVGQFGLFMGGNFRFSAPVWPATGVGMGLALVLGTRIWPAVLAGSCMAGTIWFWNSSSGPGALAAASVVMGLGNTVEAFGGAWLLERFAHGRETFRKPQSILLFVVIAAGVSLGFGGTAGMLACHIAGLAASRSLGSIWVAWWLGGLLSAIVITPLIVLWTTRKPPALNVKRSLETMLLLGLVLGLCLVIFGDWQSLQGHSSPLAFLVIPALLWTALRFGQRGTATIAFLIACFATASTLRGHGPFALGDRNLSLLLLQNFLAVITVMSLILAADVDQRQEVESQLRVSEQRYRDLFERNPQPLWVHAYDSLRFLAVNEAALNHYGYSRAEFLGMAVTDLIPAPNTPAFLQALSQMRQGQETQSHWRHRKKDGSTMEVEIVTQNLVFDERPAVMVLCHDVTERKRAELQTRAFSELGRRLSAASNPRDAAQIVLGIADLLFGWDAALFELCTGEGQLSTLLAIDTVAGKKKEVTEHCVGAPVGAHAREAIQSGARLVLRPHPPSFARDLTPFGDKERASASLMFAPVRKERETIALISIQSYKLQAYNESDLRSFQALADHCASALERIRAEGEVQRLNRELRRRVEELETIFHVAPVGLAVTRDSNSRGITANPACAAILGWPGGAGGEPEGSPRILRDGRELPPSEFPMHLAAAKGVRVPGEELDVLRPDGGRIHCYIAAAPLYDEAARARGSLGVFVDLTERQKAEQEILRLNSELERRVRERTAQLESINKELEAFSYSVSHDLRAPLRSIRGFSEVLLERHAQGLDPRGQEFLRRACESSKQMDRLIEDLLKLSRVGRSELQRQTVSLSQLAEAILEELRHSDPDRTVQIEITSGLSARGDERLLRIVLENLLRNAWKFTSRQPRAKIEFGYDQADRAFFVRDNGAGFDMSYAGKLFGVFQRLHSISDYPGTGVGLATVQRIINRHGGRVWARSAVGQGASFFFSLPDEEPE